MEGVLYNSPNRPRGNPEIICAECGQTFRSRRVADAAEELCDNCYDAQFQPLRLRYWQKPTRLPHRR